MEKRVLNIVSFAYVNEEAESCLTLCNTWNEAAWV